MRIVKLFAIWAFASVLFFLLSACVEDPLGSDDQTREGYCISLCLSATITPIPETKATLAPIHSGSEAEAAGFYYEMISSDAVVPGFNCDMVSTRPDSIVIPLGSKAAATKALGALKNVYALLFTSNGAFNGRAKIGVYTEGAATDITFTNVVTATATNCRLVVIANDNAAVTSYASSGGTGNFDRFSGNYADFQKLTIISAVNVDTDVPYAGSATVNLSLSETGTTISVPLCRTLAKITLNNERFNIKDGPARSSITLYNAGERRFATQGSDNYDGTGTMPTTAFVASTAGSNATSVTWYVGENIQPAVTSIKVPADRNRSKAPENACYIRVASAAQPAVNKSPKIGEEYIESGTKSFTYDYYLGRSSNVTDFSLRRHTNYTINTEISGTLAGQEQLAAEDGRVTLTRPVPVGLAIGRFGGPADYTIGTGDVFAIKGTYEKMLLLEPNTTRGTAADNVRKKWGDPGVQYQRETRKYWDRNYIYGITAGETVGGMDKVSIYDYCYQLTLGDVPKGTWYLPTKAQLLVIYGLCRGMREARTFDNYSALALVPYWSSSEDRYTHSWCVYFNAGFQDTGTKTDLNYVRCVRDLVTSEIADQNVIVKSGFPVIDLSGLAPLGCVLTNVEAADRRTSINVQEPSNTTLGSVGGDAYGIWNAKMSSQYQVMRADHTVGDVDWANAYRSCKQYNGEGGLASEWRLPTQRELMMIWVLHPQLLGKGSFTAFDVGNYWTCTENTATTVCIVNMVNSVHNIGKTEKLKTRCVRDIM